MIAKNLENDKALTPRDNYLTHGRGVSTWIFTLDHKRIGVMYLISVLVAFFLGGLFAMLIRVQLLTPTGLLFHKLTPTATADIFQKYNQIFTLHGAIMIFLVLIPGIPGALGNFVLPLMLGAKDVAFPRLNLLSYYFYVCGMLFALASLVLGAVDTGWTFYTPYHVQRRRPSSASSSGPSCWASARSSPG